MLCSYKVWIVNLNKVDPTYLVKYNLDYDIDVQIDQGTELDIRKQDEIN